MMNFEMKTANSKLVKKQKHNNTHNVERAEKDHSPCNKVVTHGKLRKNESKGHKRPKTRAGTHM